MRPLRKSGIREFGTYYWLIDRSRDDYRTDHPSTKYDLFVGIYKTNVDM